jgi:hypothetical protein
MQQVKGVAARSKEAPVEVVTINVPDPGPLDRVRRIDHHALGIVADHPEISASACG